MAIKKNKKDKQNLQRRSAIMNVRTLQAAQQEVPPYDEVLAYLADQRDKKRDDDLLLFDEEALQRMPEEMRAEMKDMIAKAAANKRGIAECT